MWASQCLSGKISACSAGDQVRSLHWEDSPEKKMATHSSILAWEIPEEPGRLQLGRAAVGYDLVTKYKQQTICIYTRYIHKHINTSLTFVHQSKRSSERTLRPKMMRHNIY